MTALLPGELLSRHPQFPARFPKANEIRATAMKKLVLAVILAWLAVASASADEAPPVKFAHKFFRQVHEGIKFCIWNRPIVLNCCNDFSRGAEKSLRDW